MTVAIEQPQTIDLRLARLNRTILQLAIPSVAENVLVTMVYFVDALLVGRLNDPAALAAVGLSGTLMWASEGLFQAISISSSAMVARFWGARDFEEARRVAGQALVLSVLLAVVLMAILIPVAVPFLRLMGGEPDVIQHGARYASILLAASPVSFTLSVANSIMRATGDTRKPMFITGIMNVCNLILAYVLIFGVGPAPRLELVGVAIATSIARALGGLMALTVLFSSRFSIRLQWVHLCRLDWRLIWRVVRISLPNISETLVSRLGYLLFMRTISALGTVALAAHQVAIRIESLAFMPAWGLAMAVAALVGQALGARKPDVAEQGIRRTLVLGNGIIALIGASFVIFGSAIVRLFGIQNADLVTMAATVIRISALELFGLCTMMIIAGCLRGAGDTRTPMVVTLTGTFLVRVPATYLFAITLGAGLRGVWLATALDWSVRALTIIVLYLRGRWKTVTI